MAKRYLHTQRTIAEISKRSTTLRIGKTEHWNKFGVRSSDGAPGIRQDLFGFCDLLVLDLERGFIAVQTTGKDFSGHYKKLTTECRDACLDWLKAGNGRSAIELWSWSKKPTHKGSKVLKYIPRIKNMMLEDFLPPLEDSLSPWHSGLLGSGGKS